MCQLNVLHIASARNFVHRCSGSDVALSRPTLTVEAIVPSLLLIARPRAEHPDFSTASMHGSVSLYIVAQKSELAIVLVGGSMSVRRGILMRKIVTGCSVE